jgi:hypothetical protein
MATLRLLTTSHLPDGTLEAHAKQLLIEDPAPVAVAPMLARFEAQSIPSSPYGYAIDVTGEQTLELIEGDPLAGVAQMPVLPDASWVRLQTICEG